MKHSFPFWSASFEGKEANVSKKKETKTNRVPDTKGMSVWIAGVLCAPDRRSSDGGDHAG